MWRMVIPADAINRLDGHKAALINLDQVLNLEPQIVSLTQWADVVVIERNFWGPTIGLVKTLKSYNKLVIAEFDDNYAVMTSTNPAALHWLENLRPFPDGTKIPYKPGFLNEWKRCLQMFHAYHTPTELLTQAWLGTNPRGFTINNYPDYGWPSWGVKKKSGQIPFLLGWGGGGSHYDSFNDSKILPALNQLCERYPYIQILIISGDKRIFELAGPIIPRGQLLYHSGVGLEQWPSLIPQIDVSFVPLSGKYDDYRSWLKVLELSAHGVPWVASDRPPYRLDPKKPGEGYPGGFLVKDRTDSWVKHLSMLIEDQALRERLGTEGRNWARAQNIDACIHERLELYGRLLKELKTKSMALKISKSQKMNKPKKEKGGKRKKGKRGRK